MGDSHTTDLERRCRALAASQSLTWEWDRRFGAALAVVKKEHFTVAEALLATNLGSRWTVEDDLPSAIDQIGNFLGGLRSGQLLFATDADTEPILFCAWWPWSGNSQASLRVGCWPTAVDNLQASLREWFGI